MFLLGVVLTALAVLFSLTTLALAATGRVEHATRVALPLVLATTLATGLALLLD